jgi:ABC-type oligopeptide transport system substrate-binding subunit
MNKNTSIKMLRRKLATAVCVTASLAAFATLGDGGKHASNKSLLTIKSPVNYHNFTLKSGYNYRGNNILTQNRSITLNTVVTYQKGNATYILPLKKKIFLDSKVKINPSSAPFRY